MSVANSLGKLFQRKPVDPEADLNPSYMAADSMIAGPLSQAHQGEGAARVAGDAGVLRDHDEGGGGREEELVTLPLLGSATTAAHQRRLLMLLGAGLLALALIAGWALQQANRSARQLTATGQSLMQSQRLAKAVSQALLGNPQTFADVSESSGVLARNVQALSSGDGELDVQALGEDFKSELDVITPLVQRAERNAGVVLGQKQILTQVGDALRTINSQSSDLLEVAETIVALKLQHNAPAADISAAGQLVMLTQRIGKSANEFHTSQGGSPEAVFLLGKDLNSFKEIAQGMLDGSADLRLTATRDAQAREQLQALLKLFDQTRTQAGAILGNLQGLVSAREAQAAIVADSEPLRRQLEGLQDKLSGQSGMRAMQLAALVLASVFVLLCGVGISRVQLLDSRKRQGAAEAQQRDARRQEQEAKRVNDANQAAILRLMNELQSVAEGDLTQEATVTEDITGAIADSVNYTVEELRVLVGSVQNTAARVAQTTEQVDSTSTELLATSSEQLREIRETGRSVLDMATRINEVSSQAQESAAVARQSLQAADQGLQAVQNAIGGMNAIRDQIQDTSKRIKRLGESSQEIGEITELISDITEQTNVLALNAAIQAASAGDAGRGFSVVAEEVQRLAERSADATRQIAALVKAIQTDTQDAVAAMERSTQGVVEGARLSDSAGTALSEIDRVSRRLAELIEQISSSTSREAELANDVADNIQHIFAVTEQTGEGTRTTAQQVRELSHMAEELRQSVARFKIA
ncbi:MAG: type IV pili methyl-accepting chemotaxis transducer N-terminal domain-containing protein [Proteobacteria bacterium]|nr:type IV pili methyl-accepting chemotaxis transducer N-terminal domain-containing protein [Pseudomonadota bacterium]